MPRRQFCHRGGVSCVTDPKSPRQESNRDIFITSEVLYQLSYSGGTRILGSMAEPQENRKFALKVLAISL